MKRARPPGLVRLLAAFAIVASGAAFAAGGDPVPFGERARPVDDRRLDSVRGGFSTGGLVLSFGLERSVMVDGVPVVRTTLHVDNSAAGTGLSASSGFLAYQGGAGNTISASTSAFGTVVQNTLDGQKIQTQTVIDATANSLGLVRQSNWQSSLRGALIDSLRR